MKKTKENIKKTPNKYYRIIVIAIISIIILMICYMTINKQSSNSAKLEINCNNKVTANNYKRGDVFKCVLEGEEYKFKIKSISNNKIIFVASNYGLCQSTEDGKISLTGKYNIFSVVKDETTKIYPQSTDSNSVLNINWKN